MNGPDEIDLLYTAALLYEVTAVLSLKRLMVEVMNERQHGPSMGGKQTSACTRNCGIALSSSTFYIRVFPILENTFKY